MDNIAPVERSRIMAKVKSRGNKSTEGAVVSIFKNMHVVGWRRGYPLFGNPDFVFPKKKIAVFVDGCLWHGCPRHCRIPHTNRRYWVKKISSNKARDIRIKKELEVNGWKVIRIWEHEIKTKIVLLKIRNIKNKSLKIDTY